MEKTNTYKVANKVAEIKYEDFSAEAIEQAKKITAHVIAAAIAAINLEQAKKTVTYITKKGGAEEATVWGSGGIKVPAEDAAFANGTLADILDWEDCSWTGHPSAGAVPVALALGEAKHISGKEYITALIAGYEGYQRIASASQGTRAYCDAHGWGLISWQIFSASLTAGKILGFDERKLNQTIGASFYAAIVPAGKHSASNAKSDIYHFAHGTAARNGLAAALLTELGFSNAYDTLDGNNGYWSKVSDQSSNQWYNADFGDRWLIEETYLKHWPANMWVQTPLEALDLLYKEKPFTADDIEKIVYSPATALVGRDYRQSTMTVLDAQFNLPYCLAAYILNPKASAEWFSDENLVNPKLLSLLDKFEAAGEQRTHFDNFGEFALGSFPEVTVELHFKNEEVRTKTVRYPKGHPQNPFTLEEEFAHLRSLTENILTESKIEEIIQKIDQLENLEDVGELAKLLAI